MVYLCIKEMAKISEDVIIVTSSLTKDMTGREDQFRGPAIRALCRITDVSWTNNNGICVTYCAKLGTVHFSIQISEFEQRKDWFWPTPTLQFDHNDK